MTDLELQDSLIHEIEEMTRRHSLKKLNGETWEDYKIYRQEKPYKDDEFEDDQEDYIIVLINDEDTDGEGNWIVEIQFIISIVLYEEAHQGNLILANLMNQIEMHLRKKGIIAGKYEIEDEMHKRFNQECPPTYYECALITKWKIPTVQMEGLEGLI